MLEYSIKTIMSRKSDSLFQRKTFQGIVGQQKVSYTDKVGQPLLLTAEGLTTKGEEQIFSELNVAPLYLCFVSSCQHKDSTSVRHKDYTKHS